MHEWLPSKIIPCLAPLFRLLSSVYWALLSNGLFHLVVLETCFNKPLSSNITIYSVSQKSWWDFKWLNCCNETRHTHKQVELEMDGGQTVAQATWPRWHSLAEWFIQEANSSKEVHHVLWLAKFQSVTQEWHEYRCVFNKEPPHKNSIRCWDRQLKETGSLVDKQHSGTLSISDELENIRNSFICSLKKSAHKCARELGLSKTTVHRVLKKRFTGYKFQLLHAIHPGDNHKRYTLLWIFLMKLTRTSSFYIV
jgi:hypothetical protein